MSKHNRNRKQARNTAASPNENRPHPRRPFLDIPPAVDYTEITNIRLCPGADPAPPPPPESGETGDTTTRRESRANSVKRGLRSRLLFPLEMLESINELALAYALQMKATTPLEIWLAFELARSSVQCDETNDQLMINKVRIIERIGTCWDDDNSERIDKLGSRLAIEPYNVQRALARCKHGALYLLDKWTFIAQAVETNRGLDPEQIATVHDLMGIDHVFRNGNTQVPAGTDVEALRALVARQIGQLRASLERTLNARSDSEQNMAQLGITKYRDKETRTLMSDLSRARRRFSWAMETLRQLKQGADPATLIDPDTGKPVAVGPAASAVPEPKPAAAPAPAPPPPPPPPPAAAAQPAPAAPSSAPIPPPPAGCSDDDKAMWMVAAGTILSPTATLPCDEPGPTASA